MRMSSYATFEIDLSEEFPHLASEPIVEAVIHWRARCENTLQPLLELLKARLPDYPIARPQHELQFRSELGPEGAAHSQAAHWHGFRFESPDGRNIAQFTRNGFVFSRIEPYEDWEHFSAEALRLWSVYVDVAQPPEIDRLGVRFINRIAPVDIDNLGEVLSLPPRHPNSLALPIGEFLHRTCFSVPGHPFAVSVIQASQPALPPSSDGLGLIVDIDVYTTTTLELD